MKPTHKHPYYSNKTLAICKTYSKSIAVMLSFAILNLTISCSYYTVKNVASTEETISETLKKFNEQEKYAIIHSPDSEWHLKDIIVNDDDHTLTGVLLPVSQEHQLPQKRVTNNSYKTYKDKKKSKSQDTVKKVSSSRDSKRVHRYKPKYKMPLNEVHFYLKNSDGFEYNQKVSISFSDVTRISINDKNTGRAIANVLAGTVGTIAFAVLLVAALKSSCPFVFVKNGERYDFAGELYPGTITANMQNDDYLPLPNIDSENKTYTLKVANHLKEIQYTDYLKLIHFIHDEDIEVLLDSKGHPQTFKNVITPKAVVLDDGSKFKEPAIEKDNNFYAFNTTVKTKNNTRHITFEFDKPDNSVNAKLYLTAKNSVWLDYMFGKFNEQFGSYYDTFQKKQQEVSKETIENWIKGQHIPLSVYLKTKKGWQLIERLNTVGPMATRDLVVSMPLDGVDVEEGIHIKLETGFMFWEVDYVGIDFSENMRLTQEHISPEFAIDQKGKDVTGLLEHSDNEYLVQPNIGDEVVVEFPIKPLKPGLKSSLFLLNRGYYNYIRDYRGIPDFETLQTFKQDNVFTKFSEKMYFDFVNYKSNNLAYHD